MSKKSREVATWHLQAAQSLLDKAERTPSKAPSLEHQAAEAVRRAYEELLSG